MINLNEMMAEVYHDQVWDHDELCMTRDRLGKVCLKKHPKDTTFRRIEKMFGR